MSNRRLTSDERKALFGLYAVHESLKDFYTPLIPRMGKDPYALRVLKASIKHIDRALNVVLATMTDEEKWYVAKNSKDHVTVVKPRQVVPDQVSMYVKTDDLATIIRFARLNECSLCVKNRQQQCTCELRKAMGIMIDEPPSKFGCGFQGGSDILG